MLRHVSEAGRTTHLTRQEFPITEISPLRRRMINPQSGAGGAATLRRRSGCRDPTRDKYEPAYWQPANSKTAMRASRLSSQPRAHKAPTAYECKYGRAWDMWDPSLTEPPGERATGFVSARVSWPHLHPRGVTELLPADRA